jgi:hypothetical protein
MHHPPSIPTLRAWNLAHRASRTSAPTRGSTLPAACHSSSRRERPAFTTHTRSHPPPHKPRRLMPSAFPRPHLAAPPLFPAIISAAHRWYSTRVVKADSAKRISGGPATAPTSCPASLPASRPASAPAPVPVPAPASFPVAARAAPRAALRARTVCMTLRGMACAASMGGTWSEPKRERPGGGRMGEEGVRGCQRGLGWGGWGRWGRRG